MDFVSVLLLSIIEGVTEFLPVSSTAHLELASLFLGITRSLFLDSFIVCIQVGALLGTALYVLTHFSYKEIQLKKIVYSVVPTLIMGFLLYEIIKNFLSYNLIVISTALILGGFLMLLVEHVAKKKNRVEYISSKHAWCIGLLQSLAIIPGVSRSGIILIGGYVMGIEKKTLGRFSFLVGLPVVVCASLYTLYKTRPVFSPEEIWYIVAGFFLSGFFSYFASGWFLNILAKYSLKPFAWYRILVGVFLIVVYWWV